ncbi:MAG: NAD-dependent epimerase/dehydratase family protein [Muribaculaceae bacterium]|nr:NAD-dependent epimerase/dehydratase family protein [Muribaculaceae bacterium]
MRYLVTGAAGFIGSHLIGRLAAERDAEVLAIDNLNNYYDPRLKLKRLELLGFDFEGCVTEKIVPQSGIVCREVEYLSPPCMKEFTSTIYPGVKFVRADISDSSAMETLFREFGPQKVVNLAAMAGMRYSMENPLPYVHTNISGFLNILECARRHPVEGIIYASSSSVYGENHNIPFSESDRVEEPKSVYAATKKCNELFAEVYNSAYHIPLTGLRFFTVYGEYGRPDMAPMLFADAIMNGEKIKVFNNGDMMRDFTYISDIIDGILKLVHAPMPDESRIFNIGCGHPEKLEDFIRFLEQNLGSKGEKEYLPMQPGDITVTYADTTRLQDLFGYEPRISMPEGVARFAQWYKKEYFNI